MLDTTKPEYRHLSSALWRRHATVVIPGSFRVHQPGENFDNAPRKEAPSKGLEEGK